MNLVDAFEFINQVVRKTTTETVDLSTISSLKSARDAYANLLWIKRNIELMSENIEKSITTYKEKADEVKELLTEIDHEIKEQDQWSTWSGRYDLGDYEIPKNITSWGDKIDYTEMICQFAGLSLVGYPDTTKLGPIISTSKVYESITPVVGKKQFKRGNATLDLPMVDSLDDIPPAMYLYKDNIYIRLTETTVIQVPFITVFDEHHENKKHTIRCKKDRCPNAFKCPYAHRGISLRKIGVTARCPSCPRYGNDQTIDEDMRKIDMKDIRTILMYGLNDLYAAAIYLQAKGIRENIIDLDIY
jgi:hypothetical protein